MQQRIQARTARQGQRLTRVESQAATRAALLRAGADLLVRVGYGATSIEAITEAAGFTRGAFYSNFASKDELFLALVESRIEENLAKIALAFQQGDTAADRIRSGGAFLDSLVERDREWCLLYMEFWSRAVREGTLRKRFARNYKLWRDGIAQMIEDRYAELRLKVDAPPRELASALVALFEGQVMQRLIDPKALEPEFFARLLLRFFARFGIHADEATV
jgi:AcrR family transcriptional regulator